MLMVIEACGKGRESPRIEVGRQGEKTVWQERPARLGGQDRFVAENVWGQIRSVVKEILSYGNFTYDKLLPSLVACSRKYVEGRTKPHVRLLFIHKLSERYSQWRFC